jgi:hypothetical protein
MVESMPDGMTRARGELDGAGVRLSGRTGNREPAAGRWLPKLGRMICGRRLGAKNRVTTVFLRDFLRHLQACAAMARRAFVPQCTTGDMWIDRGVERSLTESTRELCRGRDRPTAIPEGAGNPVSNSLKMAPQNAFFPGSGLTSPKRELFH